MHIVAIFVLSRLQIHWTIEIYTILVLVLGYYICQTIRGPYLPKNAKSVSNYVDTNIPKCLFSSAPIFERHELQIVS